MFSKVKQVLYRELTNGLNLEDGSKAVATAFTFGIFPIIGFSTPLNTLAALVFRLNQPIVQAINWVLGPLKLLLIIPFLQLGEWISGAEPFTLSLTEFSKIFFENWWATTQEFAWTFVHAIAGWLVMVPLIYFAIYFLAKYILSQRIPGIANASATVR